MNIARIALAALIATTALVPAAQADEHGRRRGHDRPRHEYWRGDIHRFHEHDFERWRGGRWHHGRHLGRSGWWWIVGGIWYFYPAPVYPYPNPYVPPVVLAPPAPAAQVMAPDQYWYYCSNPPGYYPYIAHCNTDWQQVLPTPPGVGPR